MAKTPQPKKSKNEDVLTNTKLLYEKKLQYLEHRFWISSAVAAALFALSLGLGAVILTYLLNPSP